ncbi:TetR family transcriptional regulator [Herbiconiux ginsengi]|uniref:TetR family transcriptional regulator n=1 Tax=Herbiconiux ginsengi TaxID=381665 RepID=UPI000B8427E5|nr:TetR family transcriptional regulator [Herbiconiux ginsengi]
MGRWEPDAAGRLAQAALELYAERGFEQTTVLDIAERAGVTERTFFRHFADKREVLFDRSNTLQEGVVAAIAAAPADLPPLEVVGTAMEQAGVFLDDRRTYALQRSAAIAANPSLQERELLKMAHLAAAVTAALRARGVPAPAAGVAAQAGVAVFRLAFERWVFNPASVPFASCVRDTLAELRALAAPPPAS